MIIDQLVKSAKIAEIAICTSFEVKIVMINNIHRLIMS